jgi:RNA polymerase sigma-70 factor (ECF subfamily)
MAEADLGDLLARCGFGDRAAFRSLYAAASPKLFGVALRILNNRGDAEEVVQEAFVKIWRGAGRFEAGRGSAMGWLVSIARNQAIDALRARKAPARDISDLPELADHGPTPEASALGADERRRIAGCLGELPADRAAAVRGAYLEGWSYEELARRFDVPLNTMRTWLRRSLLKLRECLTR